MRHFVATLSVLGVMAVQLFSFLCGDSCFCVANSAAVVRNVAEFTNSAANGSLTVANVQNLSALHSRLPAGFSFTSMRRQFRRHRRHMTQHSELSA
jgi:hypothetical protein